ncbi:hypothetical protein XA68_17078 [Ophiocordyceps unilateralis]|uniref:Uncharacterized protein n=1 Tax=Ophiocordyceps unilateralis TaxID=268505 RepID=A0A2A9P3T0_OPHUN|nr:hypothetical protein XA68_17078 [Ophiocordyceps unilateralis]
MTIHWSADSDSFLWLLVCLSYGLFWHLLAMLVKLADFVSFSVVGGSLYLGLGIINLFLAIVNALLPLSPLALRLFSLAFITYQMWARTSQLLAPAYFVVFLLWLEVDPRWPAPNSSIDAAGILASEVGQALTMCLLPIVGSSEAPPMVARAFISLSGRLGRWTTWVGQTMIVSVSDHIIRGLFNPHSGSLCNRCGSDKTIVMVDAQAGTDDEAKEGNPAEDLESQQPSAQPVNLPEPAVRSTLQSLLPERLQRQLQDRDDGRLTDEEQRRLYELERLMEAHAAEYESILRAAPCRPPPWWETRYSVIRPRPFRFRTIDDDEYSQLGEDEVNPVDRPRLYASLDSRLTDTPVSSPAVRQAAGPEPTLADDSESSQEQEDEASTSADPESPRGQEGEVEVVRGAYESESPRGQEDEEAPVETAEDPESPQGQEGEAVMTGADEPESPQGQEGEDAQLMASDLLDGEAITPADEPESPQGQEGEDDAQLMASDLLDGEAITPADEPESPQGQEGEDDAHLVANDLRDGEATAPAEEPESPQGQDGEGEAEDTKEPESSQGQDGEQVSEEAIEANARPEAQGWAEGEGLEEEAAPDALGGVSGDGLLETPPAIAGESESEDEAMMDVADAGDSPEPETPTGEESRGSKRQRRVRFASPLVMSGGSPPNTTPLPCAAGSEAESSMEWEATGPPIMVGGEPMVVVVEYELPMDLDSAASFQPPMDFREPIGLVVDDDDDDEREEACRMQEGSLDLEGDVGQAMEDGSLDQLTADLARCTLGDGEELDEAMSGGPEAVLEVVPSWYHETAPHEAVLEVASGGRHETAPLSPHATMDELLQSMDRDMAELVLPDEQLQVVVDAAADFDYPALETGDYHEGTFQDLLEEGLLFAVEQESGVLGSPVVAAQEPDVVPPVGDLWQGVAVGNLTTANSNAGPDGQQAVPAVTADALPMFAGAVPEPSFAAEQNEVEELDELERALLEAFDEVDAEAAAMYGGSAMAQFDTLPGGMASSYPPPPVSESLQQPSPVGSGSVGALAGPVVPPVPLYYPVPPAAEEVNEAGEEEDTEREDSREKIAQRPKLQPRSRRRGRAQQQGSPVDSNGLPDSAAGDKREKGKEPAAAETTVESAAGPGTGPIPIDPRLWEVTAPGGGGATTSGPSSRPNDVVSETLRADPASSRHHRVDQGAARDDNTAGASTAPHVEAATEEDVAPIDMGGGLLIPGGNMVFGPAPAPASLVQAPPAAPTTPATLPAGQVTGLPRAAGQQSRGEDEQLRRRAKALQAKKPSLFHQRGRAAPSTAYGTRAPGSAEKDRQFRSSQALADLNATDNMADDGEGTEAGQPQARELAIAPLSFVRERPPKEQG